MARNRLQSWHHQLLKPFCPCCHLNTISANRFYVRKPDTVLLLHVRRSGRRLSCLQLTIAFVIPAAALDKALRRAKPPSAVHTHIRKVRCDHTRRSGSYALQPHAFLAVHCLARTGTIICQHRPMWMQHLVANACSNFALYLWE